VVLVQWSGQTAIHIEQTQNEERFTLTYAQGKPLRVRLGKAHAQTAAQAQARYAEFAKAPQP
jgi:hypothetical protein